MDKKSGILLVYAGGSFIHRRGQRDAVLSDPPGGTAGHLPRGQQRLTVAAVGLEGHGHICRDGASQAETAGAARAQLSEGLASESHKSESSHLKPGRESNLCTKTQLCWSL